MQYSIQSNTIAGELGHGKISTLQSIQATISLGIQLLVLSLSLQRVRSSILDVLIDSHHGKINPFLLTPYQLAEEIGRIKLHLPPHLQVPVTQDNILQLYKQMEVDGLVVENHVIFSVNVPLTDQRIFHLYSLTPIPAIIHETMTSIKLATAWLAINGHRYEYLSATREKIESCPKVNENVFLCANVQSTLHRGTNSYKCVFSLFNAEQGPSCILQSTNEDAVWNQLNDNIYAIKSTVRMTKVCNNEDDVLFINGTGILELRADCALKGEDITIHGHQLMTSTIRKSYTAIELLSTNISVKADYFV